MMNLSARFMTSELALLIASVIWITAAVIHLFFAVGVWNDAVRLPAGRGPILVGPGIWALATLFGGVFVAAVYWAMRHSLLNTAMPGAQPEP